MALSDPRLASVFAEGIVGCAPVSKQVVLEIKLLNFINEFLFAQTEECAHAVIPRHLLTRRKRYRSIWRSAARSITRNYSSDSESNDARGTEIGRASMKTLSKAVPVVRSTPDLQGIPFRSVDWDGRTMKCKPDIESGGCFTTDLDSKQGVHALCDAEEAYSTKTTVPRSCSRSQPTRDLKEQVERQTMISSCLNRGDVSSQVRHDTRTSCFNVEAQAMELFTPVCTVNTVKVDREVEGQAMAECRQVSSIETDRKVSHTLPGVLVSETVSANFAKETMKPSSKKPPRPPRPSVSHPNPSQTLQVRGAKRPRLENRSAKRRKSATSGFNTLSLLALIVTLCFAAIMVVQGFLGNSKVGVANLKAEAAPEAQRDFLILPGDMLKLSPDQETRPHTLSDIHAATVESGPGSSLPFVDPQHENQPGSPESIFKLESSGKELQETVKRSD